MSRDVSTAETPLLASGGKPAPDETVPKSPAFARTVVRRVLHNPTGVIGVVLLALLVLLAVLAPLIAPASPLHQNLALSDTPPSWLGGEGGGLLGTDSLGRDVFSRILYGLRLSLLIGFGTATAAAALGLLLGLIAGYYERVAGTLLMRLADIQFAVPFVAVGIALAAVLGAGVLKLMIVFAIWGWTVYARTIFASVAQTKRMDYVTAVRIQGASAPRILFRHIMPNVLGPVIILWSTSAGVLILAESALSLLGIGIQPPDFSLGSMLAGSQLALRTSWWAAVFPGVAIALAVIGFNLLGDSLRDAFSPSGSSTRHDPELS